MNPIPKVIFMSQSNVYMHAHDAEIYLIVIGKLSTNCISQKCLSCFIIST